MAAPATTAARPNFDDDPIIRMTGLSLDPEVPHHQQAQPAAPSSPVKEAAASNGNGASHDEAADQFDEDALHESHHEGNIPTGSSRNIDGEQVLTLRALVSTREAGVIIGKAGKNVAEVRDQTGCKAGVSKVVNGVHERIMTVSGELTAVSKAYYLVAKHLVDNPIDTTRQGAHPECTSIRLLVSHQLMGSIIGKAGARIRDIQDESGARIVVGKEMLPQSTERVIEIYGLVDSIQIAISQIGECILNDIERASGTILYSPENGLRMRRGSRASFVDEEGIIPSTMNRRGSRRPSMASDEYVIPQPNRRRSSATRSLPAHDNAITVLSTTDTPDARVQTVSIPADMIGCVIGKGGSFISQIRRTSGAKLRIDDLQEGQSSRIVTISGAEPATKKALTMLNSQLESEKQRRLSITEDMEEPAAENY